MQSFCTKTPYQSDSSDEEWAFVAPYLSLLPPEAVQRRHDLRRVFDALKWIAWTGAPWRALPHDFPPWPLVYQQAMRWLAAGVFEAMVHDLRVLLREFAGRKKRPTAAILDSRTLQSTPESGHRAGYDGAKRRKGSKLHLSVDTLAHLLAAHATTAERRRPRLLRSRRLVRPPVNPVRLIVHDPPLVRKSSACEVSQST